MDAKRFTGPQAGSQKYDLLTALAVAGLCGSPGFQTSMLRLIALVTARYNWARDELTVGQREMARMWSVDERTVKRELKRLTTAGVLVQLRPGVRGRVAAYRLDMAEVLRLSAPHWDRVGPDYSARMMGQMGRSQPPQAPEDKVVRVDFGARVPVASPAPLPVAPTSAMADPWGRTLDRLARSEPALHRSWFGGLRAAEFAEGVLQLTAPSGFVAQYVMTHHLRPLLGAAQMEYPGLRRVELRAR